MGRHVGVGHQRRPDLLAPTGQEGQYPWGQPARHQGRDQPSGDGRRLLGRLETHGIAGRQCRRHHAGGNGEGNVPRGDDRGHASGLVVHRVHLPRWRLHTSAGTGVKGPHLPAVVLAEVDGLAHVGVGLGPRLARLVHPSSVASDMRRARIHSAARNNTAASGGHRSISPATEPTQPGRRRRRRRPPRRRTPPTWPRRPMAGRDRPTRWTSRSVCTDPTPDDCWDIKGPTADRRRPAVSPTPGHRWPIEARPPDTAGASTPRPDAAGASTTPTP